MSNKRYTEEDRELGLRALALYGGSYKNAAKYLEDRGTPLTENALKGFRRNYSERYYEITKDVAPLIREKMAAEAESFVMALEEVERKALKKLDKALDSMEPQHVGNALKSVTTTKAINIDKANVARGMPSEIHEKKTPSDILRVIGQKLGTVIDSTADEIKPEIEESSDNKTKDNES